MAADRDDVWQSTFDDVWRDYTRETYAYNELLDADSLPKVLLVVDVVSLMFDDDVRNRRLIVHVSTIT